MNPLHIAFALLIASAIILAGAWQEHRQASRERWRE